MPLAAMPLRWRRYRAGLNSNRTWAAALAVLAAAAGPEHAGAQVDVTAMLSALGGRGNAAAPPPPPPSPVGTVASFGLGCFWGAQLSFSCAEGVSATLAGYMGGQRPTPVYSPTYQDYAEHGYTEAVQLSYNAELISYEDLLAIFWASHSPSHATTGTQYRSVIWVHTAEQERLARQSLAEANARLAAASEFCATACRDKESGRLIVPCYSQPGCAVYTSIEPAIGLPFTPAEAYHQDWYLKLGETCADEHFVGRPWQRSPASAQPSAATAGGH